MEKEFYNCEYCFKEFTPKRRRVQKFCSNTCRSKAHHAKKSKQDSLTTDENKKSKQPIIKVEKMSLAGVGNATAGSLIASGLKSLTIKEQDKSATKADIWYLASKMKRYHKVNNLPPNEQGALPYFDLETNEVKYSFIPLNK